MNNNNFINTDWRRSKVMELSSQGYNQSEIAKILQINQPTISRDIQYLKQLESSNITKYIDHELPLFEYDKCLAALNSLQKKAWEISENTKGDKEKTQALSLAKECVINKLDLLTNATVIEDAMKFVQRSKQKLRLSSYVTSDAKGDDDPKELNHNKDEELEEKEEEESSKLTTRTITTNQVF
jgi:predicted transcriptional regulator